MKQPIPATQILSAGQALRFALGTAEGTRSTIWTVFGSRNSDDVYVGARDALPMAKLSLHQSGRWRRALMQQGAAQQNLPTDVDRVFQRWEVPEAFGDGWIHAVTITIPGSSIQAAPPPVKPLKQGTINFYQLDPGSHQARFDILIKNAGAPDLRVENIHAQVGRLELPSGGCAWVFATELTAVDHRAEADIENLRNLSRGHMIERLGLEGFQEYEKPVGAGWGFSNDNGRPTIIDLGDLKVGQPR